ncbi:MAG TPA: hypothetical protein VHJ20_09840 [Polyangia bacterium]|nr:hypothetical protein [Polyangia bacterium]
MTIARPPTEVYRQSVEKLPRAMGRAQRDAALGVVVGAAALIALTSALPESFERGDLAFVVGITALLASPYFLWRAGRRVRRYWNAFEMSIGVDSMRVAAKGMGRVTIQRADVVAIVETSRGLEVVAADGDVAHVPMTAEGYVDARARLGAWHEITWRAQDLRALVALVVLASLAGAAIFVGRAQPTLAAALVMVQIAAGIFFVDEVRASPHLPFARKAFVALVAAGTTLALLGLAVVLSF